MSVLYVASTEEFSGKTGVCLSLGMKLQKRGKSVGYMKPLGSVPGLVGGKIIDLDAYYVAKRLDIKDRIEDVSPVSLTKEFIQQNLENDDNCVGDIIKNAFKKISSDKDVVIVEDGRDINEGRFICASASELTEAMDAKVLVVSKYTSDLVVDDILDIKDTFGDRLAGVIFNQVPRSQEPMLEVIVPFLEKKGIKTYGSLPRDLALQSVTVGEIAERLGGTILTATEKSEELVENFMVGAMGQEKALRFFQRVANKAVITGGDRADVQLAALETPTTALILTGNLQPSPIIMARAEDLRVPMVLVDMDTLTTVEKTDELVGRVRIHQAQKVKRFSELLETGVNIDELFIDAGIN